MEMHQIRYFLALCEELNFTKAAERCNVAQPSLTRAIKLLEHEFGGVLVNRERANTHLSELGRTMRPHLAEVYDNAQLARSEAGKLKKSRRFTLRLGVMCTIAPAPLLILVTISLAVILTSISKSSTPLLVNSRSVSSGTNSKSRSTAAPITRTTGCTI